jgi:hypothetical protein
VTGFFVDFVGILLKFQQFFLPFITHQITLSQLIEYCNTGSAAEVVDLFFGKVKREFVIRDWELALMQDTF